MGVDVVILQLDPPLPLWTEKGDGWAHFMLDYSQEHHVMWGVFLDKTGEFWLIPNPGIRMQPNWSLNAPRSVDKSKN